MRKARHQLIFFSWFFFMPIGLAFSQEVDYTQYYLNLAGQNPAFTGIEDFIDVKIGFRQGWNSFQISNNSFYAGIYSLLGTPSQRITKKNSLRLSNPELQEQGIQDKKLRRRSGLGGMVAGRTVGPYSSTIAYMNYAYHLPVTARTNASLGVKAGYGNQRIDFSGYTVRNPTNDLFYQQLMQSGSGVQNYFTLDFGGALYSDKFYLGFSSTNLSTKNLNGDHQFNFLNNRQFNVQAAVTRKLNGPLTLNAGILLTKADGYDLIWMLNSRLRYNDLVYFGASYSNSSKVSLLMGLQLAKNISFNYAYDHYLTGINSLNINVHEIVLGIGVHTKYESRSKLW
jgi:type IX secretion system PorP/SprF family membrane protein